MNFKHGGKVWCYIYDVVFFEGSLRSGWWTGQDAGHYRIDLNDKITTLHRGKSYYIKGEYIADNDGFSIRIDGNYYGIHKDSLYNFNDENKESTMKMLEVRQDQKNTVLFRDLEIGQLFKIALSDDIYRKMRISITPDTNWNIGNYATYILGVKISSPEITTGVAHHIKESTPVFVVDGYFQVTNK